MKPAALALALAAVTPCIASEPLNINGIHIGMSREAYDELIAQEQSAAPGKYMMQTPTFDDAGSLMRWTAVWGKGSFADAVRQFRQQTPLPCKRLVDDAGNDFPPTVCSYVEGNSILEVESDTVGGKSTTIVRLEAYPLKTE
jgi:hypothetical protein